jgi:hypothetical protein
MDSSNKNTGQTDQQASSPDRRVRLHTQSSDAKEANEAVMQTSAGLFGSLMDQKRNELGAARRQSLHDQRPQTGFLGQMWHKFVHPEAARRTLYSNMI